jgi:tetratricopeptide (TPR) repeat protein
MKKLAAEIGGVILLLSAGLASAGAQEARLEDVPSAGLSPGALAALPLDASARSTLQEAVRSRDYLRAETLLAKEIDRTPESHSLLALLGRILFLDGKYLDCAIAMKKAAAISPLSDRDRFTLALSYVILNHRDWARPELERLARSDPREPLYPYWLGRLDYDAMQFKSAAANFQEALYLDPKLMKAYDNLGLTYEALGQYDDAIRIYQRAVLLNRGQPLPSPWPPLNLGTLLVKLGRHREAEVCLQESLRYDPRFPKALYQMGLLLEKEKKDEEAVRDLNLAAQYDPAYPEPHYILGRIYQRLGDKSKAKAEWQAFQKLKKENPDERPH